MEKDSVEKIVCEPMDRLERIPLPKEAVDILTRLLFLKEKQLTIPEAEQPYQYKIVEKRIKHCLTANLEDDKLIVFLITIANGIGEAMMYLYYIQWWCKTNNEKSLTLEGLCMRVFQKGFFKTEDLEKIWIQQKIKKSKQIILPTI